MENAVRSATGKSFAALENIYILSENAYKQEN